MAAFWGEEPEISNPSVWQPLETLPEQALDDEHDRFPNNEAATFFSELSELLNEPKNGPQAVLDHFEESQYFQQSVKADHLGPPELSVLNKAFEYVSLEHRGTAKPRNIWSIRAAEILRQYHQKGISLYPQTWANFLTTAAARLCRHCTDNPSEDKYQRAKDVYNNIVELDRLIEVWCLFFLAHGASESQSDFEASRPGANDMQQRFFAPLNGWEYGRDLATDQRVFCSALMTSAVLFEHLGHLALLWTRSSKDPSSEARPLNFSLLDDPELSLVSNLSSAVHGTTPNRMVLRLGLARMSVPSDVSKLLLDHIISLTRCEKQVQEHIESRRATRTEPVTHQRGLAIRATQQLSRWIERATKASLTEMHFAFTGNREFQPLAFAETPLLDKMSLRLYQIENDLPHSIWTGFFFDEKLAGGRGTVKKSPALSAIILRTLYRKAKVGQDWSVRKFEEEWERLDLSRTRIPDALWWLRFKMLWRAKQSEQALEAYLVALFDITSRTAPAQRSAAVLRLTNQMLFLVAQYGDLTHARYFLSSLLVRKIQGSAESYRWLIRLYIRLGRSSTVPKLLRGYRKHGGKSAQLTQEIKFTFASLLRVWPQCSLTATKEVIYQAIDIALLLRDPEAVKKRSKVIYRVTDFANAAAGRSRSIIETPDLREPHTALQGSLDGKPTEDQLVDGLSVRRWKGLLETYHQLAEVISDGAYSNKAKLLVTLHEHLYVFVPTQGLPLDLRAMAKELEDIVIEHFNQATPSEQLLLASGRLYWRQGDGFLSSNGATISNFKIMDAGLTSEYLCRQLEKAGMAHYTRLFRGMRWPINESNSVWKIMPERQRALLKSVLEGLQDKAAEMLPGTTPTAPVRFQNSEPVPQAKGSTRNVRRRKERESGSRQPVLRSPRSKTRKIRFVR